MPEASVPGRSRPPTPTVGADVRPITAACVMIPRSLSASGRSRSSSVSCARWAELAIRDRDAAIGGVLTAFFSSSSVKNGLPSPASAIARRRSSSSGKSRKRFVDERAQLQACSPVKSMRPAWAERPTFSMAAAAGWPACRSSGRNDASSRTRMRPISSQVGEQVQRRGVAPVEVDQRRPDALRAAIAANRSTMSSSTAFRRPASLARRRGRPSQGVQSGPVRTAAEFAAGPRVIAPAANMRGNGESSTSRDLPSRRRRPQTRGRLARRPLPGAALRDMQALPVVQQTGGREQVERSLRRSHRRSGDTSLGPLSPFVSDGRACSTSGDIARNPESRIARPRVVHPRLRVCKSGERLGRRPSRLAACGERHRELTTSDTLDRRATSLAPAHAPSARAIAGASGARGRDELFIGHAPGSMMAKGIPIAALVFSYDKLQCTAT